MSSTVRAAIIAGVLAVFLVGFFVLRPSDEQATTPTAETTATATPPPATPTAAATDGASEATPTPTPPPTPRPRPRYTEIRAVGLKPVGGVKKVEVKKGETIRIRVRSDQADEAHLHGYDVSKPVGPGRVAVYTLRARLEGIFELELENAAVPLAEITVAP